jgi:Nitrate/nitrite transporter
MWSAIAIKLPDAGFRISPGQRFWLTATPSSSAPSSGFPTASSSRASAAGGSLAAVTLLLLVPCIGTGIAVQDPTTPFGVLLFWSAVTGIAGANFATSMAVVTLWFPKSKQGSALGINGLGNLGVTVAQFLVPVVIAAGIFGALGGGSLSLRLKAGGTQDVWLQNAAFVWIPVILLCTAAVWFGTRDFPMKPKTIASQLGVARDLHTWTISALYFLTFGCFVAMGASLPLIIQSVFADAPGGAPNPLLHARSPPSSRR